MDFGAIKSVDLPAAENKALCTELAVIHEKLSDYANDLYGEPSVKRLRDDYTNGRHVFRFDADAKDKMLRLLELEPLVLRAFVRETTNLVNSFWMTHRSEYPHLDESDYFQEACISILNATYSYDGSTRFSTYVYHAVKNHLTCVVRREKANVMSATDCGDISLDRQVGHMGNIDAEMVRLAMDDAELTETEYRLVDAHMKGDNNLRARMAADEINPSTGDPWTRQRLSQVFLGALDKIKEAYLMREEKVAA